MSARSVARSVARITFNEVVRCARIVSSETSSGVKEICSTTLKAKPIVFRPRGKILPTNSLSVFSMTSNSSLTETKSPIVANGWYVDLNMRIYFEKNKEVIRTSPIMDIDGSIVTTRNGTRYQLGDIDILVKRSLAGIEISRDDPLREENIPFLVNATYDNYKSMLE
jgi:hypothetical protein